MRYAICTTDPDTIADAREAGFDAVEVNVQTLIRPCDPEPVFEEALAPVLAAHTGLRPHRSVGRKGR